ncbi:MAG: peptide chain release factor N(5)-glutamine methyltransferase [Acetobacteraceae bacterium]|nr:peptide chain release factor N(5)-glutamine methyltransferase [Acetobacteraceae bacterium]MSP31053.1 peptide chain release factor N(5)-glutamine methyltransferase [Acetobacteraceae bacterium]
MERAGATLVRAAGMLRATGIANPRWEARLLLAHAFGISREDVLANPDRVVPENFDALLARRVGREPLAFILGEQEFWSLSFAVSPVTLIPRADSETVIEAALVALPDQSRVRRIIDLGTGTGCLLLAALSEFPAAFGVGVDMVPEAAALARQNATTLGLAGRAAFMAGNWAGAIEKEFDLVLANPPYIATGDLAGLMPEVAGYEPGLALDGGVDGLAAFRTILAELPRLLATDGVAVLELGIGQDAAMIALATDVGFFVATRADLAGIARALVLRRAGP